MRDGPGDQISRGPDKEGQRREVPAQDRKAQPFDQFAKEIRTTDVPEQFRLRDDIVRFIGFPQMDQFIVCLPIDGQPDEKQSKSDDKPDIKKPACRIVSEIFEIIAERKTIHQIEEDS